MKEAKAEAKAKEAKVKEAKEAKAEAIKAQIVHVLPPRSAVMAIPTPPPPPYAVLYRYETIKKAEVTSLNQRRANAVATYFTEALGITVCRSGRGRTLAMVREELSEKWPANQACVTVMVRAV